jgi:hypothetical protein
MMGLDRIRELLDAYGAEPRRWPANERAMAEALLGQNPAARDLRAKAATIDGLLDRTAPLAPPIIDAEILIGRITAEPQSQVVAFRPAPRPAAGAFWLKVGSLAAAAVIGFLLGVTQLANIGETSAPSSGLELADISPW